MFNGIFNFFAQLLAWFYDIAGSYAGAIALLTLAVNIVLAPLTLKATRSSIELQRWAPELKKLQKEHADDREAQSAAMMAFYKEHSINPLGGCLPQLVQAPVFIVVYQVMRGLFRRADAPEGVDTLQNFDPKYLESCCPDSALEQSLLATNEANSLGLDLARTPLDVLQESVITGLPYLFLIGLVAVTGWYQHRQIQGRNPNASMNPQQAQILKYLPFMLPIFSFSFPTGLVVYFVVGNIWRVALQTFITRKYFGGDAFALPEVGDTVNSTATETPAKGSRNAKNGSGGKGAKALSSGAASNGAGKAEAKTGSNKSGSNKSGSNGSGRKGAASVGGRLAKTADEAAPPPSRHGRRSDGNSRPEWGSTKSPQRRRAPSDDDGASGRSRTGGRVTPPGTQGANPNRKKRKKK